MSSSLRLKLGLRTGNAVLQRNKDHSARLRASRMAECREATEARPCIASRTLSLWGSWISLSSTLPGNICRVEAGNIYLLGKLYRFKRKRN
jgi:hypothetical protein